MRTIIKNGTIVNSDGQIKANVVIDDEIITDITSEDIKGDVEIDASGKLVLPGLIDMHVYFRDPGLEYKEDIASGSKAAVAGGITTCLPMANTNPVNDNAVITRDMVQKAKQVGLIDLLPVGAVSTDLKANRLVEMGEMLEAGAVAFSDSGLSINNSNVIRAALEHAKNFDSFLISHCEDYSLNHEGSMNEGEVATVLGLEGMPREKEEIAVARDVLLAKLTGAHMHIAHVSTAWSLKIIEMAKKGGVSVTCEVAPHHFSFDETYLKTYDTNYKMYPPLRTKDDVKDIKEGLKSGLIDVIASDHAPHYPDEKFVEFKNAPFGIIGLQTLVPLTLKPVEEGVISLEKMVELTSCNPAKILKLKNKGKIAKNMLADIAIIDPNKTYIYDEKLNKSKSKNSPLFGKELKGLATTTIKNGRVVYEYEK